MCLSPNSHIKMLIRSWDDRCLSDTILLHILLHRICTEIEKKAEHDESFLSNHRVIFVLAYRDHIIEVMKICCSSICSKCFIKTT